MPSSGSRVLGADAFITAVAPIKLQQPVGLLRPAAQTAIAPCGVLLLAGHQEGLVIVDAVRGAVEKSCPAPLACLKGVVLDPRRPAGMTSIPVFLSDAGAHGVWDATVEFGIPHAQRAGEGPSAKMVSPKEESTEGEPLPRPPLHPKSSGSSRDSNQARRLSPEQEHERWWLRLGDRLTGGLRGFVDGTCSEARFNACGALATATVEVGDSGPDTWLFISDAGNCAIRLVSLSSRTVKTIAGQGYPGYVDGAGKRSWLRSANGLQWIDGALVFCDSANHAVRCVKFFFQPDADDEDGDVAKPRTGRLRSPPADGSARPILDSIVTNIVTIVGGSLVRGSRDGSCRSAQLSAPHDLAVIDSSGPRIGCMLDGSRQALRVIRQGSVATALHPRIQSIHSDALLPFEWPSLLLPKGWGNVEEDASTTMLLVGHPIENRPNAMRPKLSAGRASECTLSLLVARLDASAMWNSEADDSQPGSTLHAGGCEVKHSIGSVPKNTHSGRRSGSNSSVIDSSSTPLSIASTAPPENDDRDEEDDAQAPQNADEKRRRRFLVVDQSSSELMDASNTSAGRQPHGMNTSLARSDTSGGGAGVSYAELFRQRDSERERLHHVFDNADLPRVATLEKTGPPSSGRGTPTMRSTSPRIRSSTPDGRQSAWNHYHLGIQQSPGSAARSPGEDDSSIVMMSPVRDTPEKHNSQPRSDSKRVTFPAPVPSNEVTPVKQQQQHAVVINSSGSTPKGAKDKKTTTKRENARHALTNAFDLFNRIAVSGVDLLMPKGSPIPKPDDTAPLTLLQWWKAFVSSECIAASASESFPDPRDYMEHVHEVAEVFTGYHRTECMNSEGFVRCMACLPFPSSQHLAERFAHKEADGMPAPLTSQELTSLVSNLGSSLTSSRNGEVFDTIDLLVANEAALRVLFEEFEDQHRLEHPNRLPVDGPSRAGGIVTGGGEPLTGISKSGFVAMWKSLDVFPALISAAALERAFWDAATTPLLWSTGDGAAAFESHVSFASNARLSFIAFAESVVRVALSVFEPSSATLPTPYDKTAALLDVASRSSVAQRPLPLSHSRKFATPALEAHPAIRVKRERVFFVVPQERKTAVATKAAKRGGGTVVAKPQVAQRQSNARTGATKTPVWSPLRDRQTAGTSLRHQLRQLRQGK